jgi:nucleotide-binding universal stress UspA family protein
MRTVLIATDFSERAKRAEIRAAMLCIEHECSTVELMTVKEASQPDILAQILHSTAAAAQASIAEQATRELASRSASLKDHHGIQCSSVVRFGQPAVEIVSRAEAIGADLVLIGARGGNFFSNLLLGSTADKLTHLCTRPLLIVKNEPKQLYRHVLVPVDFSEDSKRAAEFALEVAPKADVTFLHAFEVWFEGQMQYAGVSRELIDDYRLKAREEARLKLNQFVTGLNAEERYLNRVVTFGIPGPVVREYAKQMQPDLIVMGKHGRSRFAELIIGSVTRDTIDQTDADLLVVPASIGPA